MSRFVHWFVLMVLSAGMALPVSADEPAEDQQPTASADQVAGWLRDLQSRDFGTRSEATRRLIEAGREAIDPVARAADSDDLETATRCIEVLRKLSQSKHAETKREAEAALQTLSESERRSVAQRAAAALPMADPGPRIANPFGNVQMQIQQVGGARNLRIQTRVVNGEREMNVEEDGRKVRITDSQEKDIVVQVTEPPADKEKEGKTSEYKAKDLDELKKKHPEAAKLYEKYTARVRIQMRAVPLPLPVPVQPADDAKNGDAQAEQRLNQARNRLDQATKRLQELSREQNVNPEQLRELTQEIQAAIRDLQQARQPKPE